MGKRFRFYDRALDLIRTGTGNSATSTPPAGSPLEQYQKYKRGDFKPSYPRAATSLPKSIKTAIILPFGEPTTGGVKVKVAFSERTKTGPLSSVIPACNHINPTPPDDGVDVDNFIPAKAIITIPGSGGTTNPQSKITGVPYKKIAKQSYTFPDGKSSTAEFEKGVRANILTAAVQANPDASVTFNSEEL